MNRERAHLQHIQRNIEHLQRLVAKGKEQFLQDEDMQAAILYYLQTMSESTTHISQENRSSQPQIEWQKIRGLRNRVVHDYLSIDLELVWAILEKELEPLQAAVKEILETMDDEEKNEQ